MLRRTIVKVKVARKIYTYAKFGDKLRRFGRNKPTKSKKQKQNFRVFVVAVVDCMRQTPTNTHFVEILFRLSSYKRVKYKQNKCNSSM